MEADLLALGKRALAAEGFEFRDGMRDSQGSRLEHHRWIQPTGWSVAEFVALDYRHIPDISDDATRGVILGLVREKHNDPTLGCHYDHEDGGWVVGRWEADGVAYRGKGATEAGALVSALEANRG